MDSLMVKSVDVLGSQIMAAQDNDGIIWIAVRWMCDALNMTEGQMKRQIKNIQNDELFSGSGSNQILNKGSGERDVFCLKLDYIPMWLAKINITQKTKEERPEFSKKLLEYQLKAKDILAAAFLPKQKSEPQTLQQQIQLIAKGTDELYQRVDNIQAEVESIKSDLPILPLEAEKIVKSVKRRGVEVLGGKESPAYNDRGLRQKLYNDLYADLKHNFDVRTYKAIRRKDADKAAQIVKEYKPPLFLLEQIENANAQQRLELEGGAPS